MECLYTEYKRCNDKYFNNELPKDIKIRWSTRMTSKAGYCKYTNKDNPEYEIAISTHYHERYKDELEDTLVHEMIHVKYPKDGHGKKFKAEALRINRQFGMNIGVHSKGRALIRYHYICKKCNHIFKRTNVNNQYENYRCFCGGKLKEKEVK